MKKGEIKIIQPGFRWLQPHYQSSLFMRIMGGVFGRQIFVVIMMVLGFSLALWVYAMEGYLNVILLISILILCFLPYSFRDKEINAFLMYIVWQITRLLFCLTVLVVVFSDFDAFPYPENFLLIIFSLGWSPPADFIGIVLKHPNLFNGIRLCATLVGFIFVFIF